ncbi:thermonuclease family protein [Sphingomonas aerolata]|uniref:thermonuclease family protein n=1 Tax=Sphingomonas aerolata TaxID=185951 RepID=UPI003A5BEC11
MADRVRRDLARGAAPCAGRLGAAARYRRRRRAVRSGSGQHGRDRGGCGGGRGGRADRRGRVWSCVRGWGRRGGGGQGGVGALHDLRPGQAGQLHGRRRHLLDEPHQDPHRRYRHPETHPPRCKAEARAGQRATLRMQALLNAGPFTLTRIKRDVDKYGRKLRLVQRDGRSLGDTLVREGLARRYGGGSGRLGAEGALVVVTRFLYDPVHDARDCPVRHAAVRGRG